MKELFFVLITLFGFSMSVSAAGNGYCNGRQTQRDYDQCYRLMFESMNKSIAKEYQELMSMPQVGPEKLRANQAEWERSINSKCRTNDCIHDAMLERIQDLIATKRTLSKK